MRHTPCGCCPPDRAGGAKKLRPEDARLHHPKGDTLSAHGVRGDAVQPLFLCAAKIVGADDFAQPSAPSGALRMRHTPCGCCPPARAAGTELFSGFTGVPLLR